MRLLLVTVGLLASLATARAQADISICLLPKVVGPCEAAMPSFYYDVETSSCEEFSFGGCDGNANRFATALECEEMCVNRNRCTVPACESSCEFGFKKDANNCPTCDCVDLCKTIECTAGQECRIVTDDRDVSTATCVDSAPVDPDNGERPPEPPSPDPCALKPLCMMFCKHGNKKDEEGCSICECNPDPCANTPMCMIFCEHGNVKDENGCPTCECKPDPCADRVMCMIFCEHGNKKDSDGCSICECNDAPTVPPCTLCGRHCQHGMSEAKDENGCDTCECNPDPCANTPMCMIFCEHGNVKDENGCPTCECKPDPCADRVMCMIFCEHGNKKDKDGCSICECNDAPTVPPCTLCIRDCEHGMSEAKDENGCDTCECNPDPCANTPMCMIFCEHGNVKDENGCPTCECKPDPCTDRVMCMIFCEHGNKKDKDGCSICECNDAPTVPPCTLCIRDCEHGMSEAKDENGCDTCECKPDPCANTPMCMIYCEHGMKKDENGCFRCECKPDPCEMCTEDQLCAPVEVMCVREPCDTVFQCQDAPPIPGCPLCGRDCQHGMSEAKDENGCLTCECNPDPCANKPMCAIYCEHGMKKDENGCPRCECNPDPCEMCTEDQTCVPVDVMCVREPCEPEFQCRDKRVPVPDCSPVRCRMFCKHGWKKDERGCDKCECAEPCENNTCTTSQRCESTSATEYRCIDPCRPVLCRMMCPYGWKKDENGCSVCGCYDPCEKNTCSETQRCEVMSANETKCVERCPSMVMCQMFCDYGFKKDSNGCDTCLCVDPCEVNTCTEGQRCQSLSAEDYTCVPVDEPCPMPMCITQCDFGYAYNERGCMTCDCRPDPCLQCSSNQMCTVEEVMCVREPCDPIVTCRDFAAKPAYCSLPSETGRCRGYFRKWYFDNATQTCKQFIYGGCGGNDNNFGTRDECEARCVNNCEIPTCGEMFCEYGWDVDEEGCPTCSCYQPCKPDTCDKDSECVAFQGNCSEGMCILNGRQECRPKKCPVGSPLLDLSAQKEIFCGRGPQRQDCPAGYYCNIHPTDMFAVCCRDESLPLVRPDICSLPREAGQCQGSEQKWHYSEDTGTCLNFTYTGCDGNANNFESQRACNDACMVAPPLPCGGMCSEGEVCDSETESCVPQRPRCAPAMCLMFCQFGFTRDANDCPLCKCYKPCENVTCGAEKECKSIPPSTPGMSSMGHAECVDKTTTTTTVLPSRPPFCELPPSIGRCRSAMPRWFRNVETGQCEQFTYGGCGGNDNRFETEEECQTICMVEVRTVCQEFMCLIWCEHGNVKDENGCDTCKCIDPCEDMPCMENQRCEGVSATERRCIDECEPVRCRMMCRHGWKKDERGCDYCSCVDPCEGNTCKENQKCEVVSANSTRCVEECEPVRCRMMCPFGWKKNERGCDYCSCADPCEVNTCSSTQKCEPQSATEYRCADEEECEPVRCRMMCPFGWKKNDRGCDYCSCVDPCEVNTCSSTQKCEPQSATEYRCADEEECEPVRCRMMCPFGWKKNERGCDYCSCVDPCEDNSCSSTQKCEPQSATEYRCADAEECEPVRCRMMCPFGWKKNERGCDYCSCVDPCEVNTCSSTQKCEPQSATEYRCADEEVCEPVRCRMMCPFGWKKNERGCDYCSCADPCEGNSCSSTQKCEPQSATEYRCADAEECEPVRCRMMCPFGWKKNERGCDYCSCVDPCEVNTCSSTQKCEPQSATEYRCADEEVCEPVRCRMMCPFGWKKNERGCDYCSCADPCEGNSCSSTQKCEPQSATEYRCADAEECEPVRCRMMCPFGWKKNERGCDYCSCVDPCEVNTCSSTQKCEPQSATEYRCADEEECAPVRCRMMCPFGWKKNERGCDYCSCVDPCEDNTCKENQRCEVVSVNSTRCVEECEPVRCRMMCSFGWKKNERGCDYCSCADPCEGNSCSSTQKCEPQSATEYRCADICPPYMCLMHCEFGFANDENGCDICKCVNPCEDNSCAGDERCEALSATEHKCVVDDQCARVDCEPGYVCRIAHCDKLQEPSCQPKPLCIQEDKNVCLERQNNALFSLWLKPKSDIFVPRCQENGLFRQVQCNDFIGMCWCVDQVTGEAKANTRVRGNPNCERPAKDEDVCPGDQAMRSRCSPLLCANHPCVTRRDLGFKPVCRVNPCRDTCEVEFYNPANNSPVECQKEKTECISKLYDANKYFLNKNQGQYVDMLNWWFSDVRDVTEEPDMKPMPEPDMEPTPEPDMEDMMKTTERPMGPTRMTPRGRTNRPIMPTRGPMGPTGTPGRSGASRGTMGPMDPPGPMGPSGPLGPQRPRTTRRPLPSQAPLLNIGMLSGVSMPMCTHSGSYAPKQCQGELCWCVQADGTPIDKTMTTGQLTCGARGIDPYMSFGNRMQCPNGVTPQPCPDACLNAQCNSGKKTVTCKADPCDGCAVKFFDDMGEEFPCMEEGTCEWVMETDWYLNDMVCQINYKGSSCHQMNFFESEEECMLEKSFKMPTAKQCQYTCMDASCPEHPDAVCFARGSDCEVTFVDIANGKPVNCEKVKRVCEQHNSRTIKQAMRAGADMRQLSMKECDKFGNYKATQCDDERTCWCVEKNGQVLPESLYKLQPNQQLECEQPFPDEIEGMVKFDANYDNIISMDSFRSFMKTSIAKALNVDAVRVIITNIKRGSIIVDYTVKINPQNEEETSDVIARVDNFNTQVNEGDILLQNEAEDGNPMELRATEGNVEFVYIGAIPPPTTTPKPEETSLSPGYIALIIIIVALVCVIIFGFVMYCRNREKSEKERRWMDYKKQISNQGLISSSRASTYSAASSLPEKSAVDYDAESQGYDNGGYKGVSSITDPSMVVTTMPDPPKPVQSTA